MVVGVGEFLMVVIDIQVVRGLGEINANYLAAFRSKQGDLLPEVGEEDQPHL